MKKIFLFLVLMIAALMQVSAQTTVNDLFNNAYKTYDSIPNITFNVKYTYSSDTLFGDFLFDEMEGKYTMSGRKAKFSMGNVEYLQNDSLFIAVYNEQKFILVADAAKHSGSFLPMRETIDSLLAVYNQQYTVGMERISDSDGEDSIALVFFTSQDSLSMFTNFTVEFDTKANVINSLSYSFLSPMQLFNSPDSTLALVRLTGSRKQQLRIDFVNYRFENLSDDFYDESNYVWVEDEIWKAAPKYTDYRVFNNTTR